VVAATSKGKEKQGQNHDMTPSLDCCVHATSRESRVGSEKELVLALAP
jgi:hypothetical protein